MGDWGDVLCVVNCVQNNTNEEIKITVKGALRMRIVFDAMTRTESGE